VLLLLGTAAASCRDIAFGGCVVVLLLVVDVVVVVVLLVVALGCW
jgi:hypothetical protein